MVKDNLVIKETPPWVDKHLYEQVNKEHLQDRECNDSVFMEMNQNMTQKEIDDMTEVTTICSDLEENPSATTSSKKKNTDKTSQKKQVTAGKDTEDVELKEDTKTKELQTAMDEDWGGMDEDQFEDFMQMATEGDQKKNDVFVEVDDEDYWEDVDDDLEEDEDDQQEKQLSDLSLNQHNNNLSNSKNNHIDKIEDQEEEDFRDALKEYEQDGDEE